MSTQELRIEMQSWKVVEQGGKVNIAGEYVVKMGSKPVATSHFNDGYQATEINFPPELLVEAVALNAKVREAIITSFTK